MQGPCSKIAKNHGLKRKDGGHVGMKKEVGGVSQSAAEKRGRATIAEKDHLGGAHWLT